MNQLTNWLRFHSSASSHRFARLFYQFNLLVWSVSVLCLVVQSWTLAKRTQAVEAESLRVGQRLIEDLAEQLDRRLRRVQNSAGNFAEELRSSKLSQAELEEQITSECRQDPFLSAVSVAFVPYGFSQDRQLYSPYYDKRIGKIQQIEDTYNYTDKEQFEACKWFLEPIVQRRPVWTTGYGEGIDAQYIDYGVPMFADRETRLPPAVRGTVNFSIALDSLTHFLNKENIGRLGGGYLMNREGRLLVDPSGELIRSNQTLFEYADKVGDPKLMDAARQMADGKEGYCSRIDDRTGQPTWLFYQRIPTTDWSLGIVIFQNEVIRHVDEIRQRQIWLILTLLVLVVTTANLASKSYHFKVQSLWFVSILMVLCSLISIGAIWYLAARGIANHSGNDLNHYLITDQKSLDRYIDQYRENAIDQNRPDPIVIPTGIFVRSIEFGSSDDAKVSGQIWQRYPKKSTKKIEQGIKFADAFPAPRAVEMHEVHRQSSETHETVIWDFRVWMDVELDFTAYPFDHHELPIQITPRDVAHEVILTPDVDAYRMINRESRPGVHEDLFCPEFTIEGSSFSYQVVHYNTDFGFPHAPNPEGVNELQFNVSIRRKPLTPFISHILPNFVVGILLFGVLFSTSLDNKRKSTSGFTGFGGLQVCAAYFFGVILMHVDLRRSMPSDAITYMEWLLLILYLMLVLVAVNSLVLTNSDIPFLEYQDNIVAKVVYGPILFGLVLFVTILVFY